MNNPSQTILDEIAVEVRHFEQAPAAFFQAWKRGVERMGFSYFGDGTRAGWEQAIDKRELSPDVSLISHAFGPMSSGEKIFLAVMVSFHNAEDGNALLKRAGVTGVASFHTLDLELRQLIATLFINYSKP